MCCVIEDWAPPCRQSACPVQLLRAALEAAVNRQRDGDVPVSFLCRRLNTTAETPRITGPSTDYGKPQRRSRLNRENLANPKVA